MKLVEVSVGRPQVLQWRGRSIQTSIFKTPLSRRVHVTRDNVEGDQQSDLSVHGGPEKAVYAYPAEHYPFWRLELPDAELPWGAFGENLTTEGLLEDEVWIGDRYRVGTAEFVVTQPRTPCYKLGIRFGRPGDAIERLARDERGLTVADVVALYATDAANQSLLERASDHPALPAAWREYFSQRLWEPDA